MTKEIINGSYFSENNSQFGGVIRTSDRYNLGICYWKYNQSYYKRLYS